MYDYNKEFKDVAQKLRKEMTPEEKHEEVEGAVWLGHLVAIGGQRLAQQTAVAIVSLQVRAQTHAPGDDLLHQAGGADVADGSGRTCDGGIDGIVVGAIFAH